MDQKHNSEAKTTPIDEVIPGNDITAFTGTLRVLGSAFKARGPVKPNSPPPPKDYGETTGA